MTRRAIMNTTSLAQLRAPYRLSYWVKSGGAWRHMIRQDMLTDFALSMAQYQPSVADFNNSFYSTLRRWQSETSLISDPVKIVSHQAFKELVKNASQVLPLILSELRVHPSKLVWVLDEALKVRPYSDSQAGDFRAMADAWIAWGERTKHGKRVF